MLLILAEVLQSCAVSTALPGSSLWSVACHQQTHVLWVGASLHDLIQPSFYFLVGIALTLSMARRVANREPPVAAHTHVLFRSMILIVTGMLLLACTTRQWKLSFVDTLTQIGLAYPFVYFIARRPRRDWWIALVVILVGYWLWFALTPISPGHIQPDDAATQLSTGLTGFAQHWQKNDNAAATFERWFLSLFPSQIAFSADIQGLATLNFIPSIATMILGLMAGEFLRSEAPRKVLILSVAGLLLGASGWTLGALGVCPVVKWIWTPSWVLFSGGCCFLFLAAFHAGVDLSGARWAAFPLIVIGMNSFVAYVVARIYPAFAFNSLRRIVGNAPFRVFGDAFDPFVYGCVVLAGYWMFLFILYRRRIFVRL